MKIKLTSAEKKILKSYKKGEWKSLARPAARSYPLLAQRQIKETRINIRLASAVLEKLRAEAQEAGIPYQTFVSSILYRYAHGKLHEERHIVEVLKVLKQAA